MRPLAALRADRSISSIRVRIRATKRPSGGGGEPITGAVARMVCISGVSFDPDVFALITVAYHAVLAELRLYDQEDPATLMVAKHIIDFAAWGERDPEKLKAATLAALKR